MNIAILDSYKKDLEAGKMAYSEVLLHFTCNGRRIDTSTLRSDVADAYTNLIDTAQKMAVLEFKQQLEDAPLVWRKLDELVCIYFDAEKTYEYREYDDEALNKAMCSLRSTLSAVHDMAAEHSYEVS